MSGLSVWVYIYRFSDFMVGVGGWFMVDVNVLDYFLYSFRGFLVKISC